MVTIGARREAACEALLCSGLARVVAAQDDAETEDGRVARHEHGNHSKWSSPAQ